MLMKGLDYQTLLVLNQSSIRAGRRQNLSPERLPRDSRRQYIVNFHFDHAWGEGHDVRMSVVLQPGLETAWLDVSPEEFSAIREVELTELEWEAAVCVGIPRWTQ